MGGFSGAHLDCAPNGEMIFKKNGQRSEGIGDQEFSGDGREDERPSGDCP
jgi:hypothetical protein